MTDWFLEAGVHFAAVENTQITLSTLDSLIIVCYKTSLSTPPSSLVNWPRGREGLLQKVHISKDTDIPSLFLLAEEVSSKDCWLCRAMGHAVPKANMQVPSLRGRLVWVLPNQISLLPSPKVGSKCGIAMYLLGEEGRTMEKITQQLHFWEGKVATCPWGLPPPAAPCQDVGALLQFTVLVCLQGITVPVISMTERCTVESLGIFH